MDSKVYTTDHQNHISRNASKESRGCEEWIRNLAGPVLDDDVPILADRSSLLRVGLGRSGIGLRLEMMLFVRHDRCRNNRKRRNHDRRTRRGHIEMERRKNREMEPRVPYLIVEAEEQKREMKQALETKAEGQIGVGGFVPINISSAVASDSRWD